ncbi:MAG: hypothetical protein ABIZ04_09975 [Opitutus sp.]
MSKLPRFRVIFEEEASEFIVAQAKRQRRRLMDICYAIADRPFSRPDFVLSDADGRMISHVATEGYLVSYWVDAPVKRVVIAEVELEE